MQEVCSELPTWGLGEFLEDRIILCADCDGTRTLSLSNFWEFGLFDLRVRELDALADDRKCKEIRSSSKGS